MGKKNKHKKSKLMKKLSMGVGAPTLKKPAAKPKVHYAEDYRGYKIRVMEITDDDDDFKGSLEAEVDNDKNDETWHYGAFEKDELEWQLGVCRREIDEDIEITLEIEKEPEEEQEE